MPPHYIFVAGFLYLLRELIAYTIAGTEFSEAEVLDAGRRYLGAVARNNRLQNFEEYEKRLGRFRAPEETVQDLYKQILISKNKEWENKCGQAIRLIKEKTGVAMSEEVVDSFLSYWGYLGGADWWMENLRTWRGYQQIPDRWIEKRYEKLTYRIGYGGHLGNPDDTDNFFNEINGLTKVSAIRPNRSIISAIQRYKDTNEDAMVVAGRLGV